MTNDCGFCEHLACYVKFGKDETTGRTTESWKFICKKHNEIPSDFENNNCTDYEDIFGNMFQWRN